MVEWPGVEAIGHCIKWNQAEHARAMRDYADKNLKAPSHATKVVKGEKVALTVEEFRQSRYLDAVRFALNIMKLGSILRNGVHA